MCARARVCVRARACVCMDEICNDVCVCVCVCVCVLTQIGESNARSGTADSLLRARPPARAPTKAGDVTTSLPSTKGVMVSLLIG